MVVKTKNGKKLLIVESPAKAKTISKYLNNEYDVIASVGHVRDLPKSNKDAVDVAGGFVPHYVVSEGKQKIIADILTTADTEITELEKKLSIIKDQKKYLLNNLIRLV